MKLELGPEIISSYKRLAYQVWYALAEFVDNSTQAYFNNKTLLDRAYKKEGTKLKVSIKTGRDSHGEYIYIHDNSIGMSEAELANAIHIGKPPLHSNGRSKYGLGLKTGASWFGDLWTIETKKLNSTVAHKITIDVHKVASGDLNLPHKRRESPKSEHWTNIEIRNLNRTIAGRTQRKVKDYLRSLYRRDIQSGKLELSFNGEILTWNADFNSQLIETMNGEPARIDFSFKVKGKSVKGFAGVLRNGSRRDAGFSIVQNDRVIVGWPQSYRPATLFGDQEGGTNDLVNQRLTGEIELDKFEVSHTKDQILFDDGEQDELEAKLEEELHPLKELAQRYRKNSDERLKKGSDQERESALTLVQQEINLEEVSEFLKQAEIPSEEMIIKSNKVLIDSLVRRFSPSIKAKLNNVNVSVYLINEMSPNDPYVLIESTGPKGNVTVIINLSHPHWFFLTTAESIANFIRHCTYDGVAEHKAYEVRKKLQPNTVKLIKDNLLRITFSMNG